MWFDPVEKGKELAAHWQEVTFGPYAFFVELTPKLIARSLTGQHVTFARQIGWHELANGELIQQAEDAGCDLLLSTDKNIRYQQDLSGRKIAW
jgi:hypothetical protein